MVQGGGTFGTFMAIGTGIRCWNWCCKIGLDLFEFDVELPIQNNFEIFIFFKQTCSLTVK